MHAAESNELDAWLRLTLISGLGNVTVRKLLSEFGTPESVLGASRSDLVRIVSTEIAALIVSGGNADAAQKALAWLTEPANRIITLGDDDYPKLLLQTADPPPLLYIKGRYELLNRPALAIVGSRNATAQGIALRP